MQIEVIGPPPFERDDAGQLRTRIGTLFLDDRVLVTLPGIHASQRAVFLQRLDEQRATFGRPLLTETERQSICQRSVDLLFTEQWVEIRPHPEHLAEAFEADQLLQELYPKPQIRFLNVDLAQVQQAMKARGELWRISALPRSKAEMRQLIHSAKVAIHEQPLYYYNRYTGTRYLTADEFGRLEALTADRLARQLREIADHSTWRNRLGQPEVAFFEADPTFGPAAFLGRTFDPANEAALREDYRALQLQFRNAVPVEYRTDDPQAEPWLNRMFSTLIRQGDETVAEEVLAGLSPGFFLQIQWLPGAAFEDGELVFDPVFDDAEREPNNRWFHGLCDPKVKGFIFNFIREYGLLEYVNVGRILPPPGSGTSEGGRNDIYIGELKPKDEPAPIKRFLRLQKWGVRERLDQGKNLLQALLESEEYTDYILDRRLGCWHLGMNVRLRSTMRRISERYRGVQAELNEVLIPVTYFERDYVPGIASDRIPPYRLAEPEYAQRLAQLLGRAAAPSLIVGRVNERTKEVVFDRGDEVVVEGDDRLPREIVVGDHAGSFAAYEAELVSFARAYARPVNDRLDRVPHPRQFAETYVAAFEARFGEIQTDYRRHQRALDTLFKHRPYDPAGSFAYRWERVLARLNRADPAELASAIRRCIVALPRPLAT